MLSENNNRKILAVILTIFFVELIRTAWISDDAAITLRTVLNFTHGYGPTFNINERVQAYTHPLWFLTLSGLDFIIGNIFLSTYLLSITLSIIIIYIIFTQVATELYSAILASVILIFSKAYLDYSTSGLENPLSNFLIIVTFLLSLKSIEQKSQKSLAGYFTICSLLYLSRPDLLLLVSPLTMLVIYKYRSQKKILIESIIIGGAPAITWITFSLFYYGFPFPNTAYAKLGTGIPLEELVSQGFIYFIDSLSRDPISITAIVFSIAVGAAQNKPEKALSFGLIIYLIYILGIGGDFMSGRFLTSPLLGAAILISRTKLSRQNFYVFLSGTSIFALIGINGTLLSDASYENKKIGANGITDERGYYFQRHGLINANRTTFKIPEWKALPSAHSLVQVICGHIGFSGIEGGPTLHLIDDCGLTDPILARLPAKYDENWRIGHFSRQLPENYDQSVKYNSNQLTDIDTKALYEKIRDITRLPLTDYSRLSKIIDLNLKKQDYNFEKYRFGIISQNSEIPAFPADSHSKPIENNTRWDDQRNIKIPKAVDFVLKSRKKIIGFDVTLDANDRYQVAYLINGTFESQAEFGPSSSALGGMFNYKYRSLAPSLLVDRVRITPLSGDGLYSVGHIIFLFENN